MISRNSYELIKLRLDSKSLDGDVDVRFFLFFSSEMANKRDSQQQQPQNQTQKKSTATTETKKPAEPTDPASSTALSDVYEFVSTPQHSSSSSGSGDERPMKNAEKSTEEKSSTDSDTPSSATAQQKRTFGEQQETTEDSSPAVDDDAKRKKRKDSEVKESTPKAGANKAVARVGQKVPGPSSRTIGAANKAVTSTETVASSETPENDPENDDGKKVPPLKIMIPQQQASGATETQEVQPASQRTNTKTNASRNHPYVASSNSNDGTSSDKDSNATGARGQSPSAESSKSDDANKIAGKSKESRILRSSRKDGKDDRGSNNSSPQLPASSTPSPAAQNPEPSGDSESPQSSQNATGSSSTSTSASTLITASTSAGTSQPSQSQQNCVELHPRKRKIKASSREPSAHAPSLDLKDSNSKDSNEPVHPHDQPFTNCYQMYIDLRKQIETRQRALNPVEPRPLKGLEDYLMNRRTYLLQGKNSIEPNIIIPPLLPTPMKETFIEQEKDRHRLKLRHIVEKEKMVLSKEQEILRVHCKAAQMIANQSQPFSVCTILKDEEVYNIITPEQEEKYRNKNRERSHGRVFYQALKELDDKYDKIKVRIAASRFIESTLNFRSILGSNDNSSHKRSRKSRCSAENGLGMEDERVFALRVQSKSRNRRAFCSDD